MKSTSKAELPRDAPLTELFGLYPPGRRALSRFSLEHGLLNLCPAAWGGFPKLLETQPLDVFLVTSITVVNRPSPTTVVYPCGWEDAAGGCTLHRFGSKGCKLSYPNSAEMCTVYSARIISFAP